MTSFRILLVRLSTKSADVERELHVAELAAVRVDADAAAAADADANAIVFVLGAWAVYSRKTDSTLSRTKTPKEEEIVVVAADRKSRDKIVAMTMKAYARAFPVVAEERRLATPSNAAAAVVAAATAAPAPAGSYATAYFAFADLLGSPERADIYQDILNLYARQTTLDVNAFDVVELADARALFAALRHNNHFRALVCRRVPLGGSDAVVQLAETLRWNRTLDTLALPGCELTDRDGVMLGEALTSTAGASAVTTLDLAANGLEDKALAALANAVATSKAGFVRIDLSSNGRAKKTGARDVLAALTKNTRSRTTLTSLSLGHVTLGADGSAALAAFLKEPNAVRSLDIGSSAAALDVVLGAALRGAVGSLASLDVSGVKVRAGGGDAKTLVQLLQTSTVLTHVDVSRTGLDGATLAQLVRVVAAPALTLVAAGNGLVGAADVGALARVAPESRLVGIDLSDNDLGDDGVVAVCEGFENSSSLTRLVLDRVFRTKPTRDRGAALDGIRSLLESNVCPLEELSLRGGKNAQLRAHVVDVVYDVAANTSLAALAIDGHDAGSRVAVALGKALGVNRSLTRVSFDDNAVTRAGFEAFSRALRANVTLREVPPSVNDYARAVAKAPDDADAIRGAFAAVARVVARNHSSTAKFDAVERTPAAATADFDPALVANVLTAGAEVTTSTQLECSALLSSLVDERLVALVEASKATIIDRVLELTAGSLPTEDAQRRLGTALRLGVVDVSVERLRAIVVENAGSELAAAVADIVHSATTIGLDFCREVEEEASNDDDGGRGGGGGGGVGGGGAAAKRADGGDDSDSDSDEDAPPPPPPPDSSDEDADEDDAKTKKSTAASSSSSSSSSSAGGRRMGKATRAGVTMVDMGSVDVSTIGKATSDLEHVTAVRARGAKGRRPPTRNKKK